MNKLELELSEWRRLRVDSKAAHLACLRGVVALTADDALHVGGTSRNELEQLRRDAERYRWLRHGDNDEQLIRVDLVGLVFLLRNEQLDEAIDKSLRENLDGCMRHE